ncbi:MAG: hypothetical protein WBD36_10620, partial [Bacteroidota bacterium]
EKDSLRNIGGIVSITNNSQSNVVNWFLVAIDKNLEGSPVAFQGLQNQTIVVSLIHNYNVEV